MKNHGCHDSQELLFKQINRTDLIAVNPNKTDKLIFYFKRVQHNEYGRNVIPWLLFFYFRTYAHFHQILLRNSDTKCKPHPMTARVTSRKHWPSKLDASMASSLTLTYRLQIKSACLIYMHNSSRIIFTLVQHPGTRITTFLIHLIK